jgi:hypothetical protein
VPERVEAIYAVYGHFLPSRKRQRISGLHRFGEMAAYVSIDGHIGPLAVTQPRAMDAAFITALSLAAQSGSSQVSAFIPGIREAVLSAAVAHGMRIRFPMLLMATRDFGDWTGYLPRNPGFM